MFDLMIDRPAWMDRARCLHADTEIFFPEKSGSTREAKALCDVCPVREECLAWALEEDERFGVWGGMSERERRQLKPPKPRPPRVARTDGEKVCPRCRVMKPFSAFSRGGRRPDGLQAWCKACCCEVDAARRRRARQRVVS